MFRTIYNTFFKHHTKKKVSVNVGMFEGELLLKDGTKKQFSLTGRRDGTSASNPKFDSSGRRLFTIIHSDYPTFATPQGNVTTFPKNELLRIEYQSRGFWIEAEIDKHARVRLDGRELSITSELLKIYPADLEGNVQTAVEAMVERFK